MIEPALIGTPEAAKVSGVSPRQLRTFVDAGLEITEAPDVKGREGYWRWSQSDVLNAMVLAALVPCVGSRAGALKALRCVDPRTASVSLRILLEGHATLELSVQSMRYQIREGWPSDG